MRGNGGIAASIKGSQKTNKQATNPCGTTHRLVGVNVGYLVGTCVGVRVGSLLGTDEGVDDGLAVGVKVGYRVGVSVGCRVGLFVGVAVGRLDGTCVGVGVGTSDGAVGWPATSRGQHSMTTINRKRVNCVTL